jgi:hypothetical protein
MKHILSTFRCQNDYILFAHDRLEHTVCSAQSLIHVTGHSCNWEFHVVRLQQRLDDPRLPINPPLHVFRFRKLISFAQSKVCIYELN